MNALGRARAKKNLSNNGVDVDDFAPVFSPDGKNDRLRRARASRPRTPRATGKSTA